MLQNSFLAWLNEVATLQNGQSLGYRVWLPQLRLLRPAAGAVFDRRQLGVMAISNMFTPEPSAGAALALIDNPHSRPVRAGHLRLLIVVIDQLAQIERAPAVGRAPHAICAKAGLAFA